MFAIESKDAAFSVRLNEYGHDSVEVEIQLRPKNNNVLLVVFFELFSPSLATTIQFYLKYSIHFFTVLSCYLQITKLQAYR